MNIVILGPQGSGKGTQAKLLSEKFNIPHISPGEILRENVEEGTRLGRLACSYINKGNMVPDDIVNKLMEERINLSKKGFILDGYPRNIRQAKFLDSVTKINNLIYIKISRCEIIRRLSVRRECEKCNKSYGYLDKKKTKDNKCPSCKCKLTQRDDDKPKAIKKRLDIYHKETEPVIDYYRKKGIVKEINGQQSIKKVFKDIISSLDTLQR